MSYTWTRESGRKYVQESNWRCIDCPGVRLDNEDAVDDHEAWHQSGGEPAAAQPGRWRVVYTGSRILTDWAAVWADLDVILEAHPRLLLRYGACGKGGDLFAEQWFQQRRSEGHDVIADPRPAPWDRLSRIAGPMRNAWMLGLGADECLAHIHPESKTTGAAGCAEFADWAGIPVTRRAVR